MSRAAAVAVAVAVLALAAGATVAAVALLGGDDRPAGPPVLQVVVARGLGLGDVAVGFALGPGRVVTVAHVLGDREAGDPVSVRRPGGSPRPATVLVRDDRDDLALLAVPGLRAPRARTAAGRGAVTLLVARGGDVRAVGGRVRRAITASFHGLLGGPVRRRPALELEADVQPGDSGAPVVDGAGRVTGVVFARSRDRAGTAYAVDAAALARLGRGH